MPNWWHSSVPELMQKEDITPKITSKVAQNCFKYQKDHGPYTHTTA